MSEVRQNLFRITAFKKEINDFVADNLRLARESKRTKTDYEQMKQVIMRSIDDEYRRLANDSSPSGQNNPDLIMSVTFE